MVVEIERNLPPLSEMPTKRTTKRWATDSRLYRFMTHSAHFMVNYRECGGVVRIIDDRDLPTRFWSGKDRVYAILPEVANIPLLEYNLLPLKIIADHDHKFVGKKKGVTLHLKNGNVLFGPSV